MKLSVVVVVVVATWTPRISIVKAGKCETPSSIICFWCIPGTFPGCIHQLYPIVVNHSGFAGFTMPKHKSPSQISPTSGWWHPSLCQIGVWGFLDVSHQKNPPTFQYTGWLIGILILVYYNPHITGQYNPLYNLTNQGFFHCSCDSLLLDPKILWP